MNYIIGLVGQSGGGKTALIQAVLKKLPEKTGILISLTTRERRSDEDDIFYRLLSKDEYEKLHASGKLATHMEYVNSFYGYEKDRITEGLKSKHLFCAVVENTAKQLIAMGYPVKLVKIIPINQKVFRGKERIAADEARAKIEVPIAKEIQNSFEPGGFEKAAQELTEFVNSL